jgi:acyl-CoA oxidase
LQVPSPDASGALDDHGVHAFIVPLRSEEGALCPGVEIHDCGYKVGLKRAVFRSGGVVPRFMSGRQ